MALGSLTSSPEPPEALMNLAGRCVCVCVHVCDVCVCVTLCMCVGEGEYMCFIIPCHALPYSTILYHTLPYSTTLYHGSMCTGRR